MYLRALSLELAQPFCVTKPKSGLIVKIEKSTNKLIRFCIVNEQIRTLKVQITGIFSIPDKSANNNGQLTL